MTHVPSAPSSLRTWLFAPGHEQRKVDKAVRLLADANASLELPARRPPGSSQSASAQASDRFSAPDVVILDWEDAVPAAQKDVARQVTLESLERLDARTRHRVAVRVSSPGSQFFEEDLAALADQFLGAVVLPKVESTAQVEAAVCLDLPIVIIIESALGVERSFELCSCHPAVRYVGFGPLDLLADLGGEWTKSGDETSYARQRVAIAARAARLAGALDGPYPRLDDAEGLAADTERGRRMGYSGRLLIHPKQVDIVERAFHPSENELEFARRVVEAARLGEREGRGAVSIDGRFVDPPVVRWAESVLARHER